MWTLETCLGCLSGVLDEWGHWLGVYGTWSSGHRVVGSWTLTEGAMPSWGHGPLKPAQRGHISTGNVGNSIWELEDKS